MIRTFHPYIRMIYDTDRPFSEFTGRKRMIDYLPDELYERVDSDDISHQGDFKLGITTDTAQIEDATLQHVFRTLKNARVEITDRYPTIRCSDVLMKYPKNMREILEDYSKRREIMFDIAHRKDPQDHLQNKGGQAYFNIAIGPLPDLRCSYLKGEENLRKKMIENMDKTVESAVREYVSHLKENGVSVKVGSGNSNLYQIVKDAF